MLTDEDKKWIDENVTEDPTVSSDPDIFPEEDDVDKYLAVCYTE